MSKDAPKAKPFTAREKIKIHAEAYFSSLHALEKAEQNSNINRTDIAKRSGLAKETVTRILNGTARNIGLNTLFLLARAMGSKITIESTALKLLYLKASNFDFRPPQINTGAIVDYDIKNETPSRTSGIVLEVTK